jgi:hypothetical protein
MFSDCFMIYLQISEKIEPTSGLEPPTCSLRVVTQALQGFAEACKLRISKRFSLLCLALCCTVLRSRWYQNGMVAGGIDEDHATLLTLMALARLKVLSCHLCHLLGTLPAR